MKYIVSTILFLCGAALCEVKFSGKEELYYKIYVFGIPAGEEILTIKERDKDYLVTSVIKTSKFFSRLYKLDERTTSYLDKATFLPYYFKKEKREKEKYELLEIKYCRESTLTYAYIHQILPKKRTGTLTLSLPVLDFTSLVYYLRSKQINPEDEFNFTLLTSFSPKYYKMKVNKVKSVYSPLFRKYVQVYKVFSEEKDIIVFFQKEPPYLPIKIRVLTSIGYVTAKLIRINTS